MDLTGLLTANELVLVTEADTARLRGIGVGLLVAEGNLLFLSVKQKQH